MNVLKHMEEKPRTHVLFRLRKKFPYLLPKHTDFPREMPSVVADLLIISTRIAKMAGLSSLFSLYRTESFT